MPTLIALVLALLLSLFPQAPQECYYTYLTAEVTASNVQVQADLMNWCEPSTFVFQYRFDGPCPIPGRSVTLEIGEFEQGVDLFERDAGCIGVYRLRLAVDQIGFGPLVRRETFFEVIPYDS